MIFYEIDQVLNWLDFVRMDTNEALKLLENNQDYIEIDSVSNYVFKKSNDGPEVKKFLISLLLIIKMMIRSFLKPPSVYQNYLKTY